MARKSVKKIRTTVHRKSQPTSRLDAVKATLFTAEAEVAKQLKSLAKRNRIRVEDATEMLDQLQARLAKERRRALKQLETRVKSVQGRVAKERKHLAHLANDAVQSALAGLNIPSRREVAELTRRVEELSRKIDALRRR